MEPATLTRLLVFLGAFGALAALEHARPRRDRSQRVLRRWGNNLGMIAVGTPLTLLLTFGGAMAVAAWAQGHGWGVFQWTPWPFWLEVALSVILFDMLIYWQHVVFHRVPLLWRMHRVHHTDRDIDASSALRFHPAEIVLSMFIKMVGVLLLGAPALGVLLFEVILNATAMFNHANWRLPLAVDAALRTVVVTPDMHRVHHSVYPVETDSNFGFCLTWWDRVFGTYRAQPRDGHETMRLGLKQYLDDRPVRFLWLLALPFIDKPRRRPRQSG